VFGTVHDYTFLRFAFRFCREKKEKEK